MQHFMKKAAALALAMVMALSLASVAFAADFPDMPDDWSTAALEAAVENGLISGKDGKIAASDSLTRAEMATIITRAFNAEVEDDISFTDVKNDTWYKTYAAKAVHMGAMNGKGSAFAGADSITRQEVFVVLARVLKLADGDAADLAAFSDADKTASWAVPAVAALVKAGYVSGSNGALNPTASITRAEFSQVMYNIFHNAYLTKAGTYEEVDGDNVIISSTNVTVKGVDVKGDVVVADGVGNGDVYFEDVTIGGRLVVRGGGMNSIHFKDSKTGTVIMSKVDGNVRLVITGESTVETVAVEAGKASTDVRVEGTVGSVVVNDNASTVVLADATVAKVEVNKANTTVSLAGETTVAEMTVAAGATDTQLQAEPTAEITKLETAEDVFIDHEDVIKDCNDEEKVNPERPEESGKPEESKAPSEGTGSNTTAHTHTFKVKGGSGADKNDVVWVAVDAKQHSTLCAAPTNPLDPAPTTTPTYCGATIYRSHDFVAGTGPNAGKTICKDCGFVSKVADQITAAGADCGHHTWKATPEAGASTASCVADGSATYECTNEVTQEDGTKVACTGTKVVTTPKTGHKWTKVTTDEQYDECGLTKADYKAPNCYQPGMVAYMCTVEGCVDSGHTTHYDEMIAATGKHVAKTEWANTSSDATHWHACATAGCTGTKIGEGAHTITWTQTKSQHTGHCSVCDKGIAIAHDYGDPVSTGAGQHKQVCKVCGYVNLEDHQGLDEGVGTCNVCGQVVTSKHTHVYGTKAPQNQQTALNGYVAAGCTTNETIVMMCPCGALHATVQANTALGHDFANSTTWLSDGDKHWKKCARTGCDEGDVDNKINHATVPDEFVTTDPAEHYKVCDTCNAHFATAAHSYGVAENGKQTCEGCGKQITACVTHTYDKTAANPTGKCTNCGAACDHSAGYNKTGDHKCKDCGKAHTCTEGTMSATYSKTTTEHWKVCDTCGKEGTHTTCSGDTLNASGWVKAPADGKHTGTCVCGNSLETACGGKGNCSVAGCTAE